MNIEGGSVGGGFFVVCLMYEICFEIALNYV